METLKAIDPWSFALDHHNYARWIPVRIRDMESLPKPVHLVQAINEMGNPFLHDNPELLKLDTHDVLDDSVVTTVRIVEKLGTNSIMSVSSMTGLPQSMRLSKRILCRCLLPETQDKE